MDFNIINLSDDVEPCFEKYKSILANLNNCIGTSHLEGNLFYLDGDDKRSNLYKSFISKRRNLAIFASVSDAIVEIGFNAGHSALLALTANDRLIYRGVDVNFNPYVDQCFKYLKNHFGYRIDVAYGDSRDKVPCIKEIYPELNGIKIGWIIDGSHIVDIACKDIINVLTHAQTNDVIMFDDADEPTLRNLITAFAVSGKIQILYDLGYAVFFKGI